MNSSIVQGKCVAVSTVSPKGFLTSECADGTAKDVGLFRLTSLQQARVLGRAACLPRAESVLPLKGCCASGNWQCPGRMGRPSPGPGVSPRGTHSMTWTPPTKASGSSASLASWAFLIPKGHEAQINLPAAHLPASSPGFSQSPLLCMEGIEHVPLLFLQSTIF